LNEVRLRLTGGVAEPGKFLGGLGDGIGGRLQLLRRGENRELAGEAGVPRL
jgi:hypothetical protein